MKFFQLSAIVFSFLSFCVGPRYPTYPPQQEPVIQQTATTTSVAVAVPPNPPTPAENTTTPVQTATFSNTATAGPTKLFIPTISTIFPEVTEGWWTTAGNAQRTSWTPEEVKGNLHVEWYRPIDAYISQNTQVIASGGLLYISTARGLYALDAVTGALTWRFDTELPLGNSPTVVNGVVYVGGFDKKLHALNAKTGVHLWSFDGAAAGYSANPLVINGKVIIGNRDGYLYAIGAQGTSQSGSLIWKYKTGGPILLTAAAKNGIVYFASLDDFAYALRINTTNPNGELVWKSQQMPGDGFQSYWPVIYTDPSTGEDRVIFSMASGYRIGTFPPGLKSVASCASCEKPEGVHNDLFANTTDPNATVGVNVTLSQPWAQGKNMMDYSLVSQYLEANPDGAPYTHKPWRRSYVILNATTGSEYSYDFDRDGYSEYAPIVPVATSNGNFFPPVAGKDGLLYFNNLYNNFNQGKVMGWRMGTPYMAVTPIQGAMDEPQAISLGGNFLYRSLCCDRVGDYYNTTDPGPNYYQPLWSYGSPLSNEATGYDTKWWFLDGSLERLYGNFNGPNGIYHNHGDQNPIVPYNGKLYVHRSNAIIAFGTGPVTGMLPKIDPAPVQDTVVQPTLTDLKSRLETEVQKIIQAGHLRPGYYNNGQTGETYYIFNDYFDNPGDTLYTLSKAYPYLSSTLQAQTRTYLQNEFNVYFNPTMYSHMGWAEGASRDTILLPPEVQADLKNFPKVEDAGYGWGWSWHYPQYNFYGMWKYAQNLPVDVQTVYQLAKNKVEVPVSPIATDSYLTTAPWELNGYIAGYFGFLKLQELAGQTVADSALRAQVNSELSRLLSLRSATFTKDSPYLSMQSGYIHRTFNVSRNFIMLVPELGNYLNQTILAKVQAAISEYNNVGPYWMASRYNSAIGEAARQNLYDVPAMFQAKAFILKEPRSSLVKYLDAPSFVRGDLFYIQNLVTTIEAP